MKTRHRDLRIFTIWLLILTVTSLLFSLVILPEMIVGTRGRRNMVKMINLVAKWKECKMALPQITVFIIRFGEAYVIRYVLIISLAVILILLELLGTNLKFVLTVQIIVLTFSMVLGYIILLGALMPKMPL